MALLVLRGCAQKHFSIIRILSSILLLFGYVHRVTRRDDWLLRAVRERLAHLAGLDVDLDVVLCYVCLRLTNELFAKLVAYYRI